jgi:hypothetical protein
MALQKGTENKKQVYLLIALGVVIVLAGGFELKDYFGGPPTPPSTPAAAQPAALSSSKSSAAHLAAGNSSASQRQEAQEAQKLSNAGIDPTLHLEILARSEKIEYLGTGRNIFSAQSAPPPIEKLAAGPRPGQPGQPGVNTPPPGPVKPVAPPIDLKYFGYTQAKDKSLQAFFLHGDDVFVARSGEIIDHRYKVGVIQANSVEVTDLGYNNTQRLPLQGN